MKLSPYQLVGSSSGPLHNIYHLFGAEPLIIEETLTALRKQCANQGFDERQKLHVETGFNWDELNSANHSLSLFASKKLVELRMPASKPGDKGSKALIEFAEHCNPDTILILVSGPVERPAQNSKWFKALDKVGASVEAAKVQKHDLPRWIDQRLKQQSIQVESGVAPLIAQYVEGNLLAAAQEINFLGLQQQNSVLSVIDVEALISDQARFTSFTYIDACLEGDATRANRILVSLEGEKLEPILLLGALSRETRKLVILADAKASGQNVEALFQRLGIWSSRSRLTQQALNRVSAIGWKRIHSKLAGLDQMIKGQRSIQNKNIWGELERLGLAMCGQASMLQ
jgi:DNA polymerase-3 subunit delta